MFKKLLSYILFIIILIPYSFLQTYANHDTFENIKIYKVKNTEYGDVFYIKDEVSLMQRSFWDATDILMAGWSWGEFLDDPSWNKFGWASLDTAALLPILPSSAYFRQGGKAYLKMDEVKKFSKTVQWRKVISSALRVRHISPNLGDKLDYAFWIVSNMKDQRRALNMKATLWRIWIFDTSQGRTLLYEHLTRVLNTNGNIISISGQAGRAGRVTKQSLLKGPFGFARVESIWEGDKLITLWITNSTTLLPIIK